MNIPLFSDFFQIRKEAALWEKALMTAACIGALFLVWYAATQDWWGPNGNERAIDAVTLGSPGEVFGSFGSLWMERGLLRNLLASLWRVAQGFALAALIGVPLGILCGAFTRIDAFFAPVSLFGRNVPVAALVPVTLAFFGMGELQKVMFLFIACVAFVMFDTARAIAEVRGDYLDTAYTLGANRRQVLSKVVIPLAMPDVFNSLRLLFGVAFGYIILAEAIDAEFGIGKLIMMSQRRGPREHVYLMLFIITLVAFVLDRALFSLQKTLFSYRYGRS